MTIGRIRREVRSGSSNRGRRVNDVGSEDKTNQIEVFVNPPSQSTVRDSVLTLLSPLILRQHGVSESLLPSPCLLLTRWSTRNPGPVGQLPRPLLSSDSDILPSVSKLRVLDSLVKRAPSPGARKRWNRKTDVRLFVMSRHQVSAPLPFVPIRLRSKSWSLNSKLGCEWSNSVGKDSGLKE